MNIAVNANRLPYPVFKVQDACGDTKYEKVKATWTPLKEAIGEEEVQVLPSQGFSGRREDIDKHLSHRLNKLSNEERIKGLHELHGVADDVPNEEVSSIENLRPKLEEMTRYITNYCDAETVAYRKATLVNKEYVENIKLACLRTDYYDSEKAAARVLSFFSYKRELFGDEKLGREITVDDFDKDDMQAMYSGATQLLQEKDQAKRGIVMLTTSKLEEYKLKTCLRNMYFVLIAAIQEDNRIQRHGVVFIINTFGQNTSSTHLVQIARSLHCLPTRVGAIHYCYDNDLMEIQSNIISNAMDTHHLCRFRNHRGSYVECISSLMSFGIPFHTVPIKGKTGELDLRHHHKVIKSMLTRDDSKLLPLPLISEAKQPALRKEEDSFGIRTIGPMDILMGRGGHPKNSMAYAMFRVVLEERFEENENAERLRKSEIAFQVLARLKTNGCHFLKISPFNYDLYEECDQEEAGEKIMHAMRNIRAAKKRNQKKRDDRQHRIGANSRRRRMHPLHSATIKFPPSSRMVDCNNINSSRLDEPIPWRSYCTI